MFTVAKAYISDNEKGTWYTMGKRIILILLAIMLLFTYGCDGKNEDTEDVSEPETVENIKPSRYDGVRIDWSDAGGAYIRSDEKVTLELTDVSDDVGVYYNVTFVDNEKEITLINVENCGEITEDDVLRVNISENDMICLSVIWDDEMAVDSIVVTGTYEDKEFKGNGTYFIAAG